jgi:hypothetical protein
MGVVHGGVFCFKWGIFSKHGDFVIIIQKSKSIGLHNAKQPLNLNPKKIKLDVSTLNLEISSFKP